MAALTSDHGEEFWDHGGFEHGHDYYREVTRVEREGKAEKDEESEPE